MAKKKNDIEELFKRLAPWVGGVQSAVPSPWQAQTPVVPQQYGQPRELSVQPVGQQPEQPVFRDEISQGNNGSPGMWNETTGQINPTKPVDPRLTQPDVGEMQPSPWRKDFGQVPLARQGTTDQWGQFWDNKMHISVVGNQFTTPDGIYVWQPYPGSPFLAKNKTTGEMVDPRPYIVGQYIGKFGALSQPQQPRQPMGASGPIPVNPLG